MNTNEIKEIEAEKQVCGEAYTPVRGYLGAEERGASPPLPLRRAPLKKPRAGLKYRVVGGRKLVRHADEVEIGTDGQWLLVLVPSWSKNRWTSLKLLRNSKAAKKRCWYLGYKRGALARNRDLAILMEHYDGRAEWVLAKVMEHFGEKS